jgi:hypothetical protein
MRRIFFTLLGCLLWNTAFAQLPVTDAAANGQLVALNAAINTLNGLLEDQNVTSKDNKYENYAQRILGNKNLDFIKKVEDYMWKADEFLKKGREIQMIYNKEEDILKKLQMIKRNSSKYASLEGGVNSLNTLNKTIRGTLSLVGGMVDNAQAILGDKNARMDTEGRRNILKETLSELIMVEMRLDQIVKENELRSVAEEAIERDRMYQEDVNKSMEVFRRYNQKKGRK